MRESIQVEIPEGVSPFVHSTESKRSRLRKFGQLLKALAAGAGFLGSRGSGVSRATVKYGTAQASAIVTAAAVAANDTITLNGTAITGKKQSASSTLTVASVANADTCVVNGITFTCATSPATAHEFHPTAGASPATDTGAATELAAVINAATDPAIITFATLIATNTLKVNGVTFTARAAEDVTSGVEFSLGSSDTDAAANAATVINRYLASIGNTSLTVSAASGVLTFTPVSGYKFSLEGTASTAVVTGLVGIISATSAAAVVTVRASVAGNDGQGAYTLLGTATRLAESATTLAGATAVANNEFDINPGSNALVAEDAARCISASTTALISSALIATSYKGVVTLSGGVAGDTVRIGDVTFTAVGGTATALNPNQFTIGGTDTADATSLKTQINAHPLFRDKLVATSSSGAVTIRPLPNPLRANSLAAVDFKLAVAGTGPTLTTQMGASAELFIVARNKGLAGNMATIASSDGTRLAITGSASRLSGGTVTELSF
jgi:hypothetical protein